MWHTATRMARGALNAQRKKEVNPFVRAQMNVLHTAMHDARTCT
jgi:hypothetical protein